MLKFEWVPVANSFFRRMLFLFSLISILEIFNIFEVQSNNNDNAIVYRDFTIAV